MASVLPSPDAAATEITPTHIYGNEGEIRLRIATGGAGQTGVLRALAERFIDLYASLRQYQASPKSRRTDHHPQTVSLPPPQPTQITFRHSKSAGSQQTHPSPSTPSPQIQQI